MYKYQDSLDTKEKSEEEISFINFSKKLIKKLLLHYLIFIHPSKTLLQTSGALLLDTP